MVIYAEYLFLENTIVGWMIFALTGKFCGVKPKKSLLILGSVFCGIYSFSIFLTTLPVFVTLLAKLAFSVLSVGLVFLPKCVRRLLKMMLIFYIVSFAMGGITIGFMYLFQARGVTNNSFIYVAEANYVNVAIGCVLAYIAMSTFAGFLRDVIVRQNMEKAVELFFDDKSVSAIGLLDTGNFLQDPLSGKPVFLISEQIAKELLTEEIFLLLTTGSKWEEVYEKLLNTEFAKRVRLIPFHSVGKAKGMLIGFRADQVTVKDKQGERKMNGTILAVSKQQFAKGRNSNYDLLLHRDVLEGGMAYHD